jgi:hypothetical protein
MGELLFWVGEDNLLFGSDYALWEPDWLVPTVMDAEMTAEQRAEFGVELTTDVKRKIMGENAARLYDVDIEAKKETFRDDEITARFGLEEEYGGTPASADD